MKKAWYEWSILLIILNIIIFYSIKCAFFINELQGSQDHLILIFTSMTQIIVFLFIWGFTVFLFHNVAVVLSANCECRVVEIILKIGLGLGFLLCSYILNITNVMKAFSNKTILMTDFIHEIKSLSFYKTGLICNYFSFLTFLVWSAYFTKKLYKLNITVSILMFCIVVAAYTLLYIISRHCQVNDILKW